MPKDYRERIIDERPFRFMAMGPNRGTAVSDEEELPDGIYSTILELEPGDAVLWFLRLATTDPTPTGRMVDIVTTAGGGVSHDYMTQPTGFTNFITTFYGNFAFDEAGEETVLDDSIYAIFDQLDDFTPGEYRLSWSIPETARANVEGAILLRGVDTTSQGNFYYGLDESPTWTRRYGSFSHNNFPVSVPTAANSLVYAIWEMTGSVSSPAGYVSVPGTQHLSYTYTDPTDPPDVVQSVVSRAGAAVGATLSVSAPTEGGFAGVGTSTTYILSAIVLHSASGITYETVEFEA